MTIEGPAQDNASSKDKQALVLLLLACCLLGLPFLQRQSPPPAQDYALTRAAGTEQWRMISIPPEMIRQQQKTNEALHSFDQQLNVSTLFNDAYQTASLPAEFALFLRHPLPINKSRFEDLTMLPGIGPRRAALLLAEREKKGRLEGPGDLLAVPGIGPVTLQRLLPLISFE